MTGSAQDAAGNDPATRGGHRADARATRLIATGRVGAAAGHRLPTNRPRKNPVATPRGCRCAWPMWPSSPARGAARAIAGAITCCSIRSSRWPKPASANPEDKPEPGAARPGTSVARRAHQFAGRIPHQRAARAIGRRAARLGRRAGGRVPVARRFRGFEQTGLPGDALGWPSIAAGFRGWRRAKLARWPSGLTRTTATPICGWRSASSFSIHWCHARTHDGQPVDDRVLGYPVRGTSTTSTTIDVCLVPDPRRRRLALEANGNIHATTTSTSGPATVYNQSESHYFARKLMEVDLGGIHVSPTETDSDTTSRLARGAHKFRRHPRAGGPGRQRGSFAACREESRGQPRSPPQDSGRRPAADRRRDRPPHRSGQPATSRARVGAAGTVGASAVGDRDGDFAPAAHDAFAIGHRRSVGRRLAPAASPRRQPGKSPGSSIAAEQFLRATPPQRPHGHCARVA